MRIRKNQTTECQLVEYIQASGAMLKSMKINYSLFNLKIFIMKKYSKINNSEKVEKPLFLIPPIITIEIADI